MMTRYRFLGLAFVVLLVILLPWLIPAHVGATAGCDWYLQHTPSPQYPNGWGECMWNTPTTTSTSEVTLATPTDTPTIAPTDASPTPTVTTGTPAATATDPTGIPQTVTSTPTPPVPAQVTCKKKCVYNQSGIPGTHAVTAVSPNAQGPYYWQVKINGVWYDVYDCNGIIVMTQPESRGETTITRLIVDSSSPTNPDDYQIIGGAEGILFDNFDY